MFATDAAVLRIVTNEVRKLPALLDQVARGKAGDLSQKIRDAEQIADNLSRIVKAERLIEVGRHHVVFDSHGY